MRTWLRAVSLLGALALAARAGDVLNHSTLDLSVSPDGKLLAVAPTDDPGHAIRLLDSATALPVAELKGHSGAVRVLAFDPAGRWLASSGMDDTVRLWDTATGREVRRLLGHERWVNALAWSPDGGRLASASTDRTVRLWDPATGALLKTFAGPGGDWALALAWSPDGKLLAAGGADNRVHLYDPASGKSLKSLAGHERWVRSVAFTPDGKRLVTGSYDGSVGLWDLASGKLAERFRPHERSAQRPEAGPSWIVALALSPDGRTLAFANMDGLVDYRDLATGKGGPIPLSRCLPWVTRLAFAPDGKRLFGASSYEYQIWAWNVPSWGLAQLPPDGGLPPGDLAQRALSLAFDPAGERLAAAFTMGRVTVWDARSRKPRLSFRAHDEDKTLLFTRDGRHLVAAGNEGPVHVYAARTGKLSRTLAGTQAFAVALSPDGSTLATTVRGDKAHLLRLYRTKDWQAERSLALPRRHLVLELQYSRTGRYLAVAHESADHGEKAVSLYDNRSGEWRTLPPSRSAPVALAFLDGDRALAAGGEEFKLWDPATGEELAALHSAPPNPFYVYEPTPRRHLAASPDGRFVAAVVLNQEVRLWDASDPRRPVLLKTLPLHEGGEFRLGAMRHAMALAWRPDGKALVVGGSGGRLREWDLSTGRLTPLPGPDDLARKAP